MARDVTFCLVTRNHANTIAGALGAALAQDFTPLDILVWDDASTDGTADIVARAFEKYEGPHTLGLRRADRPRGLCASLNAAVEEIDTDFVVLGHGADISEPNRVSRLVGAWRDTGASVVASNALVIDDAGKTRGPARRLNGPQEMSLAQFAQSGENVCCLGATLAWHRSVFDTFGPIEIDRAPASPDMIIPLRGLLLDGNHFIDEPLVRHRPAQNFDRAARHDPAFAKIAEEAAGEDAVKQLSYVISTLVENADRLKGREPNPGHYATVALGALIARLQHWVAQRNALYAAGYKNLWATPAAEGEAAGQRLTPPLQTAKGNIEA